MNTGTDPVRSEHGLLTTVAYQRAGEPATYALEGSIFVTGAAIEWLVDVGLIDTPEETATLARSAESSEDVFVVPAFSGLGAPYWDGRARGTIVGLTRGTRREHVVRATLEAIGYRTRDVVTAMEADAGLTMDSLRVDGGSVHNDVLCQIQADVLGSTIVRPAEDETTALGVAYASGLAAGVWDSIEELREHWRVDARFRPELSASRADGRYERWGDAVERSRDWAREN
jgi:glycerol kinase